MRKTIQQFWSINFSIFLAISTLILFSCNSDDGTSSCFPNSTVQATYNLNLPLYSHLMSPGAYLEDFPNGTNGSRGLIIVFTGSEYKAYDRNAPHLCPGNETTLEVFEDIQILCPADSAKWLLYDGQPLNDQTNGRTPRAYQVSLNGNTLVVTN